LGVGGAWGRAYGSRRACVLACPLALRSILRGDFQLADVWLGVLGFAAWRSGFSASYLEEIRVIKTGCPARGVRSDALAWNSTANFSPKAACSQKAFVGFAFERAVAVR